MWATHTHKIRNDWASVRVFKKAYILAQRFFLLYLEEEKQQLRKKARDVQL